MKNLNELKADRASKLQEQAALVAKAKAENRNMNEAEAAQFDALQNDFNAIERSIETEEKVIAMEKRMAGLAGMPVGETKKKKQSLSALCVLSTT